MDAFEPPPPISEEHENTLPTPDSELSESGQGTKQKGILSHFKMAAIICGILVAISAIVAFLAFIISFFMPIAEHAAKRLIGKVHGIANWTTFFMAAALIVLAVVDHIVLLFRSRQPRKMPTTGGHCPTCGNELVNGECPNERCVAHHGKQEFCPMCGFRLVDGECPQGHTIVRCGRCNSLMIDGVCTNCPHLALVNNYLSELGAYALEVVASPNDECGSYTLRVPDSFVIGNSPNDAKEPFVELRSSDNAKRFCQYVRMGLAPDGEAFVATLLISSFKPVFVDGRKLVNTGDTATLSLGGCIQLYPGYVLELVKAPPEVDHSSTQAPIGESTNGDVPHSPPDDPSTIRPPDAPQAQTAPQGPDAALRQTIRP